ncbi:hypothetical protein [Bradyrhizobium sp. BR 1433]|uniref:hypothetical protein n=1 Tax=Bradyrhizobium sp. BR 1433 TaxID=3447967 RepID=UPI003EE4C34C
MMTGQGPASDQDLLDRVRAASDALGNWLEQNDYAGNDPYQLDNIISQVGGRPIIGPLMHFARRTLKPYHALIPKRLFQAAPAIVMPQALGDSLAGEARQPDSKVSRRRAARLLTLLEDTRSPLARNAAWGLPFDWGGTGKHPKHWPTTITSTIVLTGLLDAIHLLDRDRDRGLALLEIRHTFHPGRGWDDRVARRRLCLFWSGRHASDNQCQRCSRRSAGPSGKGA